MLEDIFPGLATETIVTLSVGVAAFLTLVAVWLPLVERAEGAKRIRAVVARRDELSLIAKAPARRGGLKAQGLGVAGAVVTRLRLLKGKQAEAARLKLQRAGYRSKDALTVFLFAKLAGPGVFGGLAAFWLYGFGFEAIPVPLKLPVAAFAVLVGFFLPDILVRNQADKRREKLRRAMPDALDLLVICAEAGLTLDAALARVAREVGSGSPELAEELELTAVELGFLPERRQALENLEKRTGLPGVTALVGTLAQAEKYGTPLAQSLRVLAREMRDERLMRAEEKAARLPATLTVPMVIFIMPALFIVLIGPAILRVLDSLGAL